MNQRRYDTVCFDLYGTLVDIRTDEDGPETWRRFARYLHDSGYAVTPDDGPRLRDWFAGEWDAVRARDIAAAESGVADAGLDVAEEAAAGQVADVSIEEAVEPDVTPCFLKLAQHRPGAAVSGGPDAVGTDVAGITDADVAEARRLGWAFRRCGTQHLRLYPGADRLLRRLHGAGLRCVLVSNAQSCYTRPELESLGLDDLLDPIVISSEERVRKPHPAIFRRALERAQATAERAVMVGNDERCDMFGARLAGIDGVYLHTALSPAGDHASSDIAVASFEGADYEGLARFLLDG